MGYAHVGFDEIPKRVQDIIDGLQGRIGDVFDVSCEAGAIDVVMHVLIQDDDVTIRAYNRDEYQRSLLMNDPKDSAEKSSFFEVLNVPFKDGTGFWVVLQVGGEPDEYLFGMVVDLN